MVCVPEPIPTLVVSGAYHSEQRPHQRVGIPVSDGLMERRLLHGTQCSGNRRSETNRSDWGKLPPALVSLQGFTVSTLSFGMVVVRFAAFGASTTLSPPVGRQAEADLAAYAPGWWSGSGRSERRPRYRLQDPSG